ncbi:MAG: phosphoglucosamine mutase [bacterium]
MTELFGTDGIRGRVNQYPMTAQCALHMGAAIAHLCKNSRCDSGQCKVFIGKDTRISGSMLESALVSGICSQGVDAVLVGVIPTPAVAYFTSSMSAHAGIVISASHNPYKDNGIKIFDAQGYKLSQEKEQKIENLLLSKDIDKLLCSSDKLGICYHLYDALGRYIVFLKNSFSKNYSLDGIKIAIDCANGATCRVGPSVFSELGAQVMPLSVMPTGDNINLNCGSEYPEQLAQYVIEKGMDIGFAFDGDGDRVIVVDENGQILSGDQIIAICASLLKEEGRLMGNCVVTTIMSNIGLRVALEDLGITHLMSDVGDRNVMEMMRAKGACIGGEQSGHLIFFDHHTTGDGIIAALQLLICMKKRGEKISELARIMKVFPQSLMNIEVSQKPSLDTIPEIAAIMNEIQKQLQDRGRVLVRYSGTQPICRVMVEGPTEEEANNCCTEIAKIIEEKLS